ncbi:SurA N-terminal domain protein [uncultured Desulfatiglans sp.]|nr:SurA N-terminal domain protein [uncultured Desulfatiglans sp.]
MRTWRVKQWMMGLLVGFLLLAGGLCSWAAEEASKGDGDAADKGKEIVAKVNGVAITEKELDQEMSIVSDRLMQMGRPVGKDQMGALRKNMLEQLIAWELFYQEAQRQKLEVSDEAVAESLSGFKKQFADEKEAEAQMGKMGFSEEEMTRMTKRKMTIQALLEKEVVEKIEVTDAEAKAYYDENPQYFEKPEMVRASHILIKVPADADEETKAAARKKLEAVQERLKKGEDFGALAKEVSECPSAANGGDLGPFPADKMVKPFSDAAFALEPGNVSGIVETQFGYHLIRSAEKIPPSKVSFEEVKDRIREFLKEQKVQKALGAYAAELTAKADIERIGGEPDPVE